jgi:hypothetical protein
MQKPPLNPDVADTAPSDSVLTVYDEEHVITYLLDADAQGADWREVAGIVQRLDPEQESDRARRRWITRSPCSIRLTIKCGSVQDDQRGVVMRHDEMGTLRLPSSRAPLGPLC